MHLSPDPFSGPEPLGHTQSLVGFITITCGSRFSVQTGVVFGKVEVAEEANTLTHPLNHLAWYPNCPLRPGYGGSVICRV